MLRDGTTWAREPETDGGRQIFRAGQKIGVHPKCLVPLVYLATCSQGGQNAGPLQAVHNSPISANCLMLFEIGVAKSRWLAECNVLGA